MAHCPAPAEVATLESVAAAVVGYCYSYANEKVLQDGLEQAMRAGDLSPRREVTLGRAGRIDFMVDRVGVEVKIGGTVAQLQRQLTRYAARPEVDALLVVTTRRTHRALPTSIGGVLVTLVVVGGGL